MALLSRHTRNLILDLVCYLFVLLFVYAAVSKLLDFENFQVQLGQSPLLSAFAGIVSWVVPISEIGIALLLVIPQLRIAGLYAAFSLMVMFTTYIFIILNFSSFVPCSCGGVLEKLGWTEHLLFNISFIVFGLIGLLLAKTQRMPGSDLLHEIRFIPFITNTGACFAGSILLVSILYLSSEKEIHRNNGFIRRYPPHPVTTIKGTNIKYNSYYIAGVAGDRIYLGNTTAPAHILSVDTSLTNVRSFQIEVYNDLKIAFHAPQIKIKPPYFFLIDGTVPVIFRGSLSDWKAKLYWKGSNTFSQIEPVSETEFVFSGLDTTSGQNIIGRINTEANAVQKSTKLLQNRANGVFETDGMLHYNPELKRLIYVYYYRNEFLIADPYLNLDFRGQTIDTLQQAAIKIAYQNSGRVRKLAHPPIMIQMRSCTYGKYLFTKSNRLGRYEPEEMLEDASIIDVYDLEKHTYEFSFYLYDFKGEKIKSFQVYKNILIGLSNHYIVLYRLQPINFDLKPITYSENDFKSIRPYQGEDRKPVTE